VSRPERLVLLGLFAVLLALLGWSEPAATALGAAAGVVPGIAVAGRLKRLSGRMDARLGVVEERPTGLRMRVLVVRGGMHLLVLGGLLLSTLFVPFIGDELYAGSAAAVTGLVAVLTAARLR
jgi:hypothetical protein